MPDFNVCIPCNFAKYIPIIAVKKIIAMVFKAPTWLPILIMRNISNVGMPINIIKNGINVLKNQIGRTCSIRSSRMNMF